MPVVGHDRPIGEAADGLPVNRRSLARGKVQLEEEA